MSIPEYVGDIYHSINITLDKKIYAPGDKLSGQILLEFLSPVTNHGLSVNIKGYTSVGWPTAQKHHYAVECYFDETKELLAPENNKIFPPGSHYTFSFDYTLPKTIPSSVDFQHGKIVYFCQAAFGSVKSKIKYFPVVRERDLRLIARQVEDPVSKNDKVFKPEGCLGCCPVESCDGEITIPKSGYIPGEFIIVNASINNQSNIPTKSTKVYLKQTVIAYARDVKKVEENVLAKVVKGPIQPSTRQIWVNECLVIPDVPSSKLEGCTIIDIAYRVEMIVFTYAGPALTMQIPVEIGTIPIKEDYLEVLKETSGVANLHPISKSDIVNQQYNFDTIELEKEPLIINTSQMSKDSVQLEMTPITTSWTETSTPFNQEFSNESKQWSFTSSSSKVVSKVQTTRQQKIITKKEFLLEGETPLLYVSEDIPVNTVIQKETVTYTTSED